MPFGKKQAKKINAPVESLRNNKQFKRVYKWGNVRAGKSTVLIYCRNRENITRLGISISKKVGKSVVRHHLKRLYKEAFRQLKHEIIKGYDVVLVARKGADNVSFWDILNELRYLLAKGKLLNGKNSSSDT